VAFLLLAWRLLPGPIALGTAMLFAAHPLHVEAVALGVNQSEIGVGLLAMLMLCRHLDRRRSAAGVVNAVDWVALGALYGADLAIPDSRGSRGGGVSRRRAARRLDRDSDPAFQAVIFLTRTRPVDMIPPWDPRFSFVGGFVASPVLMAVSVLLGAAPMLAAQTVITGTVRQDGTNRPLAGVEVLLEKPKRQTVTNDSGRYAFADVPRGDRVVLFRQVGYRPVRHMARVASTDTVWADALLVPFAVPLDPIKVSAPAPSISMNGLGGFEERRRLGLGLFVDSTELRRNEHVRLADLLARLGGVQINQTREAAIAVSLSRVGPFGERCPMSVILDGAMIYRSAGVQIHQEHESALAPPAPPPDLNSLLGTTDLVAVEVYRRTAEVPIEFGGQHAACGVIVLWSRRAR